MCYPDPVEIHYSTIKMKSVLLGSEFSKYKNKQIFYGN